VPDFTQEQYLQAFNSTPDDVKEMLLAEHTSAIISSATQRYGVETDKILSISAIIGYIMVGLVPVKNLIPLLREEIGLDEKTSKDLAYELREQVFSHIASVLSEMQKNIPEYKQVAEESETASRHRDESVTRKVMEE